MKWKKSTLDTRDVNRHATTLKQNGFLLYNSFQWPNKTITVRQQTNQYSNQNNNNNNATRGMCRKTWVSYGGFLFKAHDWLQREAHQPTHDRTQYRYEPRDRVRFLRFSILNRESFSLLLVLCYHRDPWIGYLSYIS